MRNSNQSHSLWRSLSGVLMALGMWGLILPPPITADVLTSAPDRFGVTFPFENVSLEFASQGDGGYAWADSQGREGVVDADLLSGIEVLSSSQTADGRFETRLIVPDGAGGSSVYTFSGQRRDGGLIQGMVVDSAGAAQAVQLSWDDDGSGGGGGGMIWFVVGAIATGVGLAVCGIVSINTDCIGDCAAGCGDAGMASSGEGFCGSCTCTCN